MNCVNRRHKKFQKESGGVAAIQGCPVRSTVVQEEMKAAWHKAVRSTVVQEEMKAAWHKAVPSTGVQDKILCFLWFWLRSLLLHSDLKTSDF